MDGLLIVDKPSGPTSHDVVARVRRALRERRIGHTGTLDPMASGVLPLVIGRATRLARFLPGDKAYDAAIRLGLNTDTCDAQGEPVGPTGNGPWPMPSTIETALDRFRGTFTQQPPAFSAKKVAGRRSYELARRARTEAGRDADREAGQTLPEPVRVSTSALELLEASGSLIRLRVRCAAGFYVRSLAFDLGAVLGTGAHLEALRRIEATGFGLDQAVLLERIEADAAAALIPLERMLGAMPAVLLTPDGVSRAKCGRNLGPADATCGFAAALSVTAGVSPAHIRLLDDAGQLVAMAEPADEPGLLHPVVVLM